VLVANEPVRYFRPAYVGGRGWIGAWLDVDVDWPALESLLRDAQALVVPVPSPKARATRKPPRGG
jgi:hypothetical protein